LLPGHDGLIQAIPIRLDSIEVKVMLALSALARRQGFTGFAPAFHFLIKLPALDTPIGFSSNLVKGTLFTKPIFKG
jgi:hypothetical protein